MDELRTALWIAPQRPQTYFLLARTHRRLGELDAVPALLRHAVKLGGDPQWADRERWLLLAQSGRLGEAEPHLPELLIDPGGDGPDICEAYVLGYFGNLRTSEARQLLDVWQKDYPEDAQSHFMQGYLNFGLSRYREAAADYRRGLELAPDITLMRYRLAEVLIQAGEWEEAGKELLRCLDEDAQNPDILTTWAKCLSHCGQPDRAREVIEGVLAQTPDHVDAHQVLAELDLAEGRFQHALPHLQAVVSRRPYERQSRWALARTLQALGRAEEAKRHFDYVSEAEQAMDRVARLTRQVVARTEDTQLRYEIGTLLLKYGPPEDGIKWLMTVLQLAPDHRGAHEALTAFYDARGRWQEAEFHRRQASGNQGQLNP
jgi:predicted Zn-dependent protease